MTIFAPYHYLWAKGNTSIYAITSLEECMRKLPKIQAVTAAFAIAGGPASLWVVVTDAIPDMKKFVDSGRFLIISLGGLAGPFLEDACTEDELYTLLEKLLLDTGCRALDFDVEGASLTQKDTITKRNKVIRRLQQQFPGLYVSFTLPAGDPKWGTLTTDSVWLLKDAITNNVDISVVNGMVMDIYRQTPYSWGDMAISMIEDMKTTLSNLYPKKTQSDLYRMLGATFMAGVNDDSSIFSVEAASQLAKYATEKNIGLISFWALQRDQERKNSLATSSMVQNRDFEFCTAIQSNLPPPISPPQPAHVHIEIQFDYNVSKKKWSISLD